jgi:predicted HTH transcriptional regulator
MTRHSSEYLAGLVRELVKYPAETSWLEFKHNNENPQEIGEYISALSNAAALEGKANAYMLWGIDNQSREIVGTGFQPLSAKKGNQPLESWLLQLLQPRIHFRFDEVIIDGCQVVILEIDRASHRPVRFNGREYIRVGEVKKPLKDAPELERRLWRIFDTVPFEEMIALERAGTDEVLQLLDYPAYFDLLDIPLPSNRDGILEALAEDELICPCDAGGWNITNLGGILFAKQLKKFARLRRKAIRVIQYRGTGRTETYREQEGGRGYACGFEGLIDYINGLLPANELLGTALRKDVPMFPEIAIRELVANALIHQDFSVTGAGPMVEIFDDRIEITNPGEPLVDTQRFLDTPPRSRNETMASLMRRLGICEERGSGIDKVVFQIELHQLPAPLFEIPDGFTRSVLFAHKDLKEMDKADRVRACYLHACLCYVTRKKMTNSSIRERFGIADHNAAYASNLLNEAVAAGMIVIQDPNVGTRGRSYVPFWAKPEGYPPEVA